MKTRFTIFLSIAITALILVSFFFGYSIKGKLDNDTIRKIENLEAKSKSYDQHIDECDSLGSFFMQNNNLTK